MSHFDDIVDDNLGQRWRHWVSFKPTATPVRCMDGIAISVQASRKHSCTPKRDRGPYTTVEVKFREEEGPPEEWEKYGFLGIYHNVPVDTVRELICQHGGEVERRH